MNHVVAKWSAQDHRIFKARNPRAYAKLMQNDDAPKTNLTVRRIVYLGEQHDLHVKQWRKVNNFMKAWLQIRSKDMASQILKAVAGQCKIKISDILSPRRFQEIVFARDICYYLMRKHTNLSLVQIGKRLGGRDHSSVLHGIRKVLRHIDRYAVVVNEVERVLGVR